VGQSSLEEALQAWEHLVDHLQLISQWIETAPLSEGAPSSVLLLKWRYFVCSLFTNALLDQKLARRLAKLLRDDFGIEELVDPLAGSGWHGALMSGAGLRVICSDLDPGPVYWTAVECARAEDVAWHQESYKQAALFLSWPPLLPYDVGAEVLKLYRGDIFVFIGELAEDAESESLTGGAEFHQILSAEWEQKARLEIPRWPGFCDALCVFRRRRKHAE